MSNDRIYKIQNDELKEIKPYGMICVDTKEDLERLEKLIEEANRMQWVLCSERMPKNEDEVEITYINKNYHTGEIMYFTARAFHEDGTMTTEDSDYCWNDIDNWKYDEEKDAYIIPEGWWEVVRFGEVFGVVDMPVIAWRPLPEPYKEE